MSLNDPLANALSVIEQAERMGRSTCLIPKSKTIASVLSVMKDKGYIGEVEEEEESRKLRVKLSGMINKCGAIKPRYNVKSDDFERFEKRYLPAKNMGVMIISTSKGIISHLEAKEQHFGGRLIAYCY